MLLTHYKVHFTLEVPTTSTILFNCKSKLSNRIFFLTFKRFDNLMILLNSLPQKNIHITQVNIYFYRVCGPQSPAVVSKAPS